MIIATAYDSHVEVKVTGSDFMEFAQDLDRFKNMIPQEDREYKTHKKVWIIKNPEKYTRVPLVQRALIDRQKQIPLF